MKGEIVWEAEYSTWGNTAKVSYQQVDAKIHNEVAFQPLRFQGQYYDSETGLHYNRFRYYDPDVGRFTSKDPIGLLGGDNFYVYAPNPVSWVDPLGLSGKIYRGMKIGTDGKPIVGSNANSLGIRPGLDKGMSGATDIKSLPTHRKPTSVGGTQKNAEVFSIKDCDLQKCGLKGINDHDSHVSIEPIKNMSESDFIKAINKTKNDWIKE
jgi:RHS repeat-associated protein